MMFRTVFLRCFALSVCAVWSFSGFDLLGEIRDGGVDPSNLGKGDWIYFVSNATNKLGGHVPSVTNIPSFMAYEKSQGMQFIVVKVGTGSTNFNGSGNSPQFNSNLVYQAHAVGLKIFGYTRSYGTDIPGEINLAAYVYNLGADGFVIDAEAEWESSHLGTNGPARALQYGQGIRQLYPNKFLAHAPFPIISYHSSLPYKEFGLYCDAVMPQDYWKSIGVSPSYMVSWMDNEWRTWQNSLTGIYTNAIKPLAPLAQGWSPATNEVTTGAEITEFVGALKNDAAPVTVGGYRGMSFWRADLHNPDMWNAIGAAAIGDQSPPTITVQPQSQTVLPGATVTFNVTAPGAPPVSYPWRLQGTNIPGAMAASFTRTNAQSPDVGDYSVAITNGFGFAISSNAALSMLPYIFGIAATPGARGAIIIWDTSPAASSQIEFGTTPAYGNVSAADSPLATHHSLYLSALLPDTTYYFRIVARLGTNESRSARFTFATAGTILIDNVDATFTSNWSTGTSSADKYSTNYRFTTTVTDAVPATATFTPNITTRGNYDVYVWYPQGSNRATNAPFTVAHNGGATTTTVDQTTGGGAWRPIATNRNFSSGSSGFVRLGNDASPTNKVVIADAVKFVYRANQDSPTGSTVPDWWAWHYFGSNVNASLDPDGDGYSTAMEYMLGTDPTDAASHLEFKLEVAGSNTFRASVFPFYADRVYRLQNQTSLNSGGWLTLTNLPQIEANGSGAFPLPTEAVSQNFLRLKVEWLP